VGCRRRTAWLRERIHKVTILQHTGKHNEVTYGSLWQRRVSAFMVFNLHGLAFSVPQHRIDILSEKIALILNILI
jgi:hypothetical protein